MKVLKLGLVALAVSVAPQVNASPVVQDYLDPYAVKDATPLYPDGIGKISYNCNSGDFVLKAHGLNAGYIYELRSGGALDDPEDSSSVAVGNGTAGLGNNVLIKGNQFQAGLGANWNLWQVESPGGQGTRVLIGARTLCTE